MKEEALGITAGIHLWSFPTKSTPPESKLFQFQWYDLATLDEDFTWWSRSASPIFQLGEDAFPIFVQGLFTFVVVNLLEREREREGERKIGRLLFDRFQKNGKEGQFVTAPVAFSLSTSIFSHMRKLDCFFSLAFFLIQVACVTVPWKRQFSSLFLPLRCFEGRMRMCSWNLLHHKAAAALASLCNKATFTKARVGDLKKNGERMCRIYGRFGVKKIFWQEAIKRRRTEAWSFKVLFPGIGRNRFNKDTVVHFVSRWGCCFSNENLNRTIYGL